MRKLIAVLALSFLLVGCGKKTDEEKEREAEQKLKDPNKLRKKEKKTEDENNAVQLRTR